MVLKQDVDPVLEWEWIALKPQLRKEYKTFFPLLLITGIRTTEALNLTARDLWEANGAHGIVVRRLKRSDNKIDRLVISSPTIFAELQALGRAKRSPLFDFSRIAAWRALQRFCLAAGIRPLSPHQFRHTYARLFVRTHQVDPTTGFPMTALDQMIALARNLGHSSHKTVEHYFQPHGDELLEITASVGETFESWFN
jgi:integrase